MKSKLWRRLSRRQGPNNVKHADKMLYGKRGIDVLHDLEVNKSTAFTEEEREVLALTGLPPSGVDTEENQLRRVTIR